MLTVLRLDRCAKAVDNPLAREARRGFDKKSAVPHYPQKNCRTCCGPHAGWRPIVLASAVEIG
jgi:hypothetical protein